MPVQTRSMIKAKASIKVPKKKSVKNHSIEKSSTNMLVYKDDTTGIEYITEEHIKLRGINNKFYTPNNIHVIGLHLYDKITEIHYRYRKSIPKEVADREDLFALAPEGYLWKEDKTGTYYFHWDGWKSLQRFSYKRGAEFNILYK